MSRITFLICAFLLCIIVGFSTGALTDPSRTMIKVSDYFDYQEPRRVLLLGNSRIYTNDMPMMIRHIADSAGDKNKWQITMEAPGGATFQFLATENPNVPKLLAENWDDILMQSQSHAQFAQSREGFRIYGSQLIQMSRRQVSQPWLIVNWAYDEAGSDGLGQRKGQSLGSSLTMVRKTYFNAIQTDSKALAAANGARTINVGLAWEYIRQKLPRGSMTTDGNHPSIAGSYLQAYCIYTVLAPESAQKASYIPAGLDNETVVTIRKSALAACSF